MIHIRRSGRDAKKSLISRAMVLPPKTLYTQIRAASFVLVVARALNRPSRFLEDWLPERESRDERNMLYAG